MIAEELLVFICYLSIFYEFVYCVGDDLHLYPRHAGTWCYSHNHTCGEHTWRHYCNLQSKLQSPINFSNKLKYVHKIPAEFRKSDFVIDGFNMTFKGYTVKVIPNVKLNKPTIRYFNGSDWKDYLFHSCHIHWGAKDDIGSEHSLDGRSFSAEFHLAFYDKTFPSMELALEQNHELNDTVIVVAVFIEVVSTVFVDVVVSDFLNPLVENLGGIKKADDLLGHFVDEKLMLKDLFEGDMAYNYVGSLTSPDCRAITWMVLRRPLCVPSHHLDLLRHADFQGKSGHFNNFRSLQSIHQPKSGNTRSVYTLTLSYD